MFGRAASVFVVMALGVAGVALTTANGAGTERCLALWNRSSNAGIRADIRRFERVAVRSSDTKAGGYCNVIGWAQAGAPWQTYVLWTADPDGLRESFSIDLGGRSFGDGWFFEAEPGPPDTPNAAILRDGQLEPLER